MQIEITRQVNHKETISVNFPYYYTQYLDNEYSTSVIYGKIEPERHTIIHLTRRNGVEVEIEHRGAGTLGCYFTDEYVSDEDTFAKALEQAKQIVNGIFR